MAGMPSDPARPQGGLFVVLLAGPTVEIAPLLRLVEGAALVRELARERVVVSTTTWEDGARLAALPGVLQVLPDRREQLTPDPDGRVPRHRDR